MLLWANIHGSVLLGAIFLWVYAFATWAQNRWDKYKGSQNNRPGSGRWWQLALAGTLACFYTPLGMDMFAYALSVGNNPTLKEQLPEWMPAWKNPAALAFVLIWLTAVGAIFTASWYQNNRRFVRPVLVVGLFLLASLQASRNVVFLGLVLC